MKKERMHMLVAFILLAVNFAAMGRAADKYRPNIFYRATLTSTVWKGENQSYAQARQLIDQEVSGGQPPTALAARYQAQANHSPVDSLAVFRWAYASRKAALAANPFSMDIADRALNALNQDSKPHPYDYVRLQFLLASDVWPTGSLEPLGRRLLQYNADDQPVMFQLVADMENSMSLQDKEGALSLAQNLVRQSPKDPKYHALLAGAYLRQWMHTKERPVADRALAEYQLYLKTAPADDNFRRGAEQMVWAIKRNE